MTHIGDKTDDDACHSRFPKTAGAEGPHEADEGHRKEGAQEGCHKIPEIATNDAGKKAAGKTGPNHAVECGR